LLSIVLFAPLVGFLILLLIPASKRVWVRTWALLASLAGFSFTLPLLAGFRADGSLQFVERLPWIPTIGAEYHLAADGFSILLVAMSGLLGFLALLGEAPEHKPKTYYGSFLILQTAVLGVFLAFDFLLFFVFFELTLIPMYLIIAMWGGERRQYAATKFLLYTLAGSIFLLLGGLYVYQLHGSQTGRYTFNLLELQQTQVAPEAQLWVFLAIAIGAAVKIPMWPVHTWLPDAHTEAPTAGSVILAGVLLKLGTYALIRYAMPLAPQAATSPQVIQVMAWLSMIAIVYGALVSLVQTDWKRLVAYSSVSHMGFCTLGLFALNRAGVAGSMLQQINHGISTSMLFFLVGMAYSRRHTRRIADYGGLSRAMPLFAAVFLITALSSMGMPPLNGFIGEFTILRGVLERSALWGGAVVLGVLLGAAYLLWLFQRVCFGEISEANQGLGDLTLTEKLIAAPMVGLMIVIGVAPSLLFHYLEPAADSLLRTIGR
jgi:NADH-quinone oxidoreductase subunit M